MKLYGDYRYEIAEGREATNLEVTQSQTIEKKSVPTKDKTDVLITVVTDFEGPVRPIAKPVTVSSNSGGTDVTKHTKNKSDSSENGPSKINEVTARSLNNNKSDINISSTTSNDISTNMLIVGASLLNHIEAPAGVVISNQSGATFDMAEKFINAAEEDSNQELKPDQVVIHLGTNDVMYLRSSAPASIVKLGVAMERIHQKYPAPQIGLCSIPPKKGNSSEQKQCNEVAKIVNEYMTSLADAQPDNYTFIDTWSKQWSSRGHAIKQYYDPNDPKGVHLNKKGKELFINKIMTTMYPDPQTTKRKSSSTHSPSANNNTKEQKLDNSPQHANTDLITFTDTQ